MIERQLLGDIMTEKGFVTAQQLKEALERQREIVEEETLPEHRDRASLVAEARLAADMGKAPLLGKILVDMQVATTEQVEEALKEQEKAVEVYRSLDSDRLGGAIEIGSIVNSTINLAEVLALTMRYANRVTDSVASTLMLLDGHTGELVFSVPTGPKAEELTDVRIPPGKGVAGWVAKHEKTVLIPDAQEDPRFYPAIDKKIGFETKSMVCVPLRAKKKLIGVLQVINRVDGAAFTAEDTLLLRIFANQAAMAIENARLYAELEDRMEHEIQMRNRLAEAEKFRALGQMASGIAHDFNNVLMGIQGNISLMLLDIPKNDPYFEQVKDIEEYVSSGANVTRQLLDFARGHQSQVGPVDLNALIEKTSQMFGRTKKEINVVTRCEEDLWAVEVNREQIERVLLNLFVNAAAAMPEGGELCIETENVWLNGHEVKSPTADAGRYVKISVADSGVGMDQATCRRIFEPFFTTKNMGRGTGLGLACAYGTVTNHGGLIKVSSHEGHGTTFTIYLPASEKKAVEGKKVSENALKGAGTVLLCDDEGMVIKVCEAMLKAVGYNVLTARSGEEAIDICKREKGHIDLTILNLMMPGMGGGEAYDRLKEINPNGRFLLSTGCSIDGEARKILKRGCDGFIQKPYNLNQLSEKIEEILGMEHGA